ncbi:unnamed protein product [Heterobilharzia americana]|nr:unnamed protein product [Heterobilharzia americana]
MKSVIKMSAFHPLNSVLLSSEKDGEQKGCNELSITLPVLLSEGEMFGSASKRLGLYHNTNKRLAPKLNPVISLRLLDSS